MSISEFRPVESSTMHQDAPVDLAEAEVRVVALGGWRVSDSLLDADDPQRLLGFIEKRDDGFEVMQIGRDFTWTMFRTMGEAISHLLTRGRDDVAARASSELAWLSALPKSSID